MPMLDETKMLRKGPYCNSSSDRSIWRLGSETSLSLHTGGVALAVVSAVSAPEAGHGIFILVAAKPSPALSAADIDLIQP